MLYIRVDMNNIIATGHVMRCLSIADAARESGEETTFLVADDNATEVIKQRGYRVIILHTKWNDLEEELPVILQVIKEKKIEKLVIDTYQVTYKYLEKLSQVTKTIYIDDLDSFIYPVHALICYSNCWAQYNYQENYKNSLYHTRLYLGCTYTPLRKEFAHCQPYKVAKDVDHLLLMSGGTDQYDSMRKIMQVIELSKFKKIDVICGRYYKKAEEFRDQYKEYDNITIHSSVGNIEDYMKTADMAITAGGTTLYELCAVGVPTITYSIADNQINQVEQFSKDGIMEYAGDTRYIDLGKAVNEAISKCSDWELRKLRSRRMQALVDGKGANRIVQTIGEDIV